MTTKQIRIMFYDEKEREWVVDTMEVNEEAEEETETSGEKDDSRASQSMAYL